MCHIMEEESAKKELSKELHPEELKKEFNKCQQELNECQRQKKEYLVGWQRARADLINYKKEEQERLAEMARYTREELILNILAVLDNFDIIEKQLADELRQNPYIKGVLRIKKQFQDFLKDQELEEIKCLGEKFNPEIHEVVEQAEIRDKEPGLVVEEIQKGYILNGKVIRSAKVKIVK